jgi:hypothetical protein
LAPTGATTITLRRRSITDLHRVPVVTKEVLLGKIRDRISLGAIAETAETVALRRWKISEAESGSRRDREAITDTARPRIATRIGKQVMLDSR